MPVNRVKCDCAICHHPIPANGGRQIGIGFVHLCCGDANAPRVAVVREEGGVTVEIENVNGRCEDAPCCGCCGSV